MKLSAPTEWLNCIIIMKFSPLPRSSAHIFLRHKMQFDRHHRNFAWWRHKFKQWNRFLRSSWWWTAAHTCFGTKSNESIKTTSTVERRRNSSGSELGGGERVFVLKMREWKFVFLKTKTIFNEKLIPRIFLVSFENNVIAKLSRQIATPNYIINPFKHRNMDCVCVEFSYGISSKVWVMPILNWSRKSKKTTSLIAIFFGTLQQSAAAGLLAWCKSQMCDRREVRNHFTIFWAHFTLAINQNKSTNSQHSFVM